MANESELEYEEGTEQPADARAAEPVPADDDDLPLYEGAIFGAGAFVVGYLTMLMLVLSRLSATGTELESQDPGSWKVAIWMFLGHQGVGLEADGEVVPIAEVGQLGANSILYFVPLVALVAAGYGIVKYVDGDSLEDNLKAAALIAPGYLVLSLVFALLAGHEYTDAEISVSLVTADAILYAGVLYPVVFGMIGALLASWPRPVDRILDAVQ